MKIKTAVKTIGQDDTEGNIFNSKRESFHTMINSSQSPSRSANETVVNPLNSRKEAVEVIMREATKI